MTVQAVVGEPLYRNDVIATDVDSTVGVVFQDGTTTTLSASTHLVIAEFALDDENRAANSVQFELRQGSFAFVPGIVATTGSFVIDTTLATIRSNTRRGGLASLTLAVFTFALIEKLHAATDDFTLLQYDTLSYKDFQHGKFEIQTKEAVPRVFMIDDPQVTFELNGAGSGVVSVQQLQNTPAQMANLLAASQSAATTYSVGLQDPFIRQQQRADIQQPTDSVVGSPTRTASSASGSGGGLAVDPTTAAIHTNNLQTLIHNINDDTNIKSVSTSLSAPVTPSPSAVIETFVPTSPVLMQATSVANNDTLSATADTPVTYTAAQMLGNDKDVAGNPLTIASVTSVTGGTAALNSNGTVTFTPQAHFAGAASFTYAATDGLTVSNTATVTVNVAAVEHAPVANSDTLAAVGDMPVTYTAAQLLGNDTDLDGDPLTIASVTSGIGGTAVLNSNGTVTFTPGPNFHGAASFTYAATDGLVLSNTATVTFNIAATDQAPVLGNVAPSASYTEAAAPVTLSSGLTVSDADNPTLASAAVSISGGLLAGDTLAANLTGTAIAQSYNPATGVLTLSGSDTLAHYQQVLDSVAFSSSSQNPTSFATDNSRTISWVVNDGTVNSTTANTTVNVTAVDQAPVIGNVSGTVSTAQNTAVAIAAPTGSVTDVDASATDLLLATLSVAHGTLSPIGNLAGLTIVNGQNGSNGVLSFTGTQAAITQAIESGVTYTPTLNYNGADQLSIAVNDQGHTGTGGPQTTIASIAITVATDQAPVLGNVAPSASYTEAAAPVTLSAGLTVSDADNPTLASAAVSISGGLLAGDTLAANLTGTAIAQSYNPATGVLTLSGSDTLAHYQQVLDSVAFSSSSQNPTSFATDNSRTISWVVNDGTVNSTTANTTVNVTAVDQAPVIGNVSGTVSTAQNTAVAIAAPTGSVTDVDASATDLLLATLSVAHGTLSPIGNLAGLTIVNGQNGSNGVLSFTGTQAAITQAIESGVTYTPTLNYNGADQLSIAVNDQGHTGTGGPQTTIASIAITVATDQAPVLGNVAPSASYTEAAAPVTLSSGLTVSDADNPTLASAAVSISGGLLAGDTLAANLTGTAIAQSYNPATGVLTLSGSDTLAHYQQVLDSVAFSSSSQNPTSFATDNSRTISWVVNDGTVNSTTANTTVNVTAVDQAPVIGNVSGTVSTAQNTAVAIAAPTGSVTDVDASATDLLLATLSVAHGTLSPIGNLAGLTIVNGQNGSNGVLSFTGTQAAITQAIESGVTYTPTLNYNGADQLSIAVNDQGHTGTGGPQTTIASIAITVATDQAPVLGNVAPSASYTEAAAPVTLSAGLTVSDADNPTLASAAVSISGGLLAGDTLAANLTGTAIAQSYNPATGVLTLSGSDTLAHYQQVLDSVAFSSSSQNPTSFATDNSRTISWVVNDGTVNSTTANTTVNVTAVDQAPVIGNVSGTVSTAQNTAVAIAAPTGSVTDVDASATDLLLATLSVAHGTLSPIGNLAGLTIVNGQNGSNGVLSFTGTQAAITQAIESGVTYTPTLNYNGADQLSIAVNDQGHTGTGGPQTTIASIAITVATDQAPVLGNVAPSASYTEAAAPVTLSSGLTVSDADNPTLASAAVSISGGLLAGDTLAANLTGTAIAQSYNPATGVLTLSGSDTLAHYQQVLDSVAFSSSSQNPTSFATDNSRTISWVVNDGTVNSTTANTTVNVTAVDQAPVIGNVSGTVSTAQNTAVAIAAPTGSVTDVDASATDLLLATLSVAHGTLSPIGNLAGLTIVNGQNGSNGVLSFTGTQAAITQAIESGVTYTPTLNYNGSDQLSIAVNDQGHTGTGGPQTTIASIAITVATDQAPVLGNVAPSASYTEAAAPVTLSSGLTVSDADNPTLASAAVSISGGLLAGDTLAANLTGTAIAQSYNPATGVLTLSGSDTLAHYQQVLDSVAFSSSSQNPTSFATDNSRTISWVVNDGTVNSTTANTTVNVTAVDQAPVIGNVSGTVSTAQNTAVAIAAPTGSVTDVDASATDLLLATLSVAHGTLSPIGNLAGLTIVNGQNGSNGVLSFTGTQAAITQAIESGVTYTPTLNYNGSDQLSIAVNDQGHTGTGGPQTTIASIAITVATDQAPVLGNVAPSASYTEAAAPVTLSSGLTVSDADNPTLASAAVSISGGLLAGDTLAANLTGTAIAQSYNPATGVLTLSGSDTLAHYQQVLDSVAFSSSSQNPTSFATDNSRTISWVVNDGTVNSTTANTTVNVTAVDQAPVIGNVAASASYTEAGTAVTLSPGLTVSDADNTTLASAAVSISGGAFFAGDTLAANLTGTAIAQSYNPATGVLTLSGSDTLAHYQQVLDSVTYSSNSQNPTNFGADNSRSISWVVNDGSLNSTTATTTVNISATDQAPTISGDLTISVNNGSSVVITTADLQAVDSDNSSSQLIFTVSGTANGHVARISALTTAITSFTEADLEAGSIAFVQDGSLTTSASFSVSLSDGVAAPTTATVNAAVSLPSDLVITSGTVDLGSGNQAIHSITQSGGTLIGTGILTVSGTSAFSGGSESGTGTTKALGGANFTNSFSFTGGRNVELGGTSTVTGLNIHIGLNAPLLIDPTAIFDDHTSAGGFPGLNIDSTGSGSTAAVNNQGLFRKDGTASSSVVNVAFNNTGTVDVQTGTLDLAAGGIDTSAVYESTTGSGTIDFGGGTHTLDSASTITANALFGGGTTTVNGTYNAPSTAVHGGTANLLGIVSGLGNVSIGSGTLNIASADVTAESLSQTIDTNTSGGTLTGTGILTVGGTSAFSGGSESGTGTTKALGGANFTNSFSFTGGRNVELGGTSTVTGLNIHIGLNAPLLIDPTAIFDDHTSAGGFPGLNIDSTGSGSTAAVNNQGLFRKDGTASSSVVNVAFNNTGTVDVQTGTLDLAAGGIDTSAVYESTTGSGTIDFGGGTHTLDSASTITANALFGGGTTTVNGTYNAPSTAVHGGTANLLGSVSGLGNVSIGSGTLNIGNADVLATSISQTVDTNTSGGTLTGTGILTVSGTSAFSGGSESGAGTTKARGGAIFSSTNFSLDGGRTLQLDGTSTATGTSGQINLNGVNPNTGVSDAGSGILTISSGATFNDQTSSSGLSILATNRGGTDTGSAAVVNNLGTFTKSGSAVTSTISTTFNNTGTVNVQSGTLKLSGGGTISGTFNLAVGALVQFNSAFAINGSAAFLGGSLSGSGPLIIGNGATLEISSSVSGLPISFSSGNSILTLDSPSSFSSPIAGLAIGDTINLVGISVASAVINGSTLNITTNNQPLSYQVSGAVSTNSFSVISGASGSQLVLVPNTGTIITGTKSAGSASVSFNPTSTHLYQLQAATVLGSGGHGFIAQSSDSNSADSIIAEFDPASSIAVTGTNFNGVDLVTAGASIFIFNAASVSAAHYGIGAFQTGFGNITINSSGQINSGSSGINANNQATAIPASANSVISVSASNQINSGTTPNSGGPPAGIIAGYLGGSSSTANLNVNGTVIVNNAANITAAAGDGIEAYNFGNGNVTVNDASGTTVTGAQHGIAAYAESGGTGNVVINVASQATINAGSINGIFGFNSGAGNITITTAAGDLISGLSGTTGSSGIDALNEATSIPTSANSSIVVTAYGTINSGTAPTGAGNPPAGISAGYFGGTTAPANPPLAGLNGTVVVNNFANITAAAGDGIRAYNYGNGNITVDDNSGSITALGGASPTDGYGAGIGAYNHGPGNINVSTATGITINSGSSGVAAINEAPATPSTTTVSVLAYGTITSGTIPTGNGSPAAGVLAGFNFNSSADDSVAGSVIIDDFASISAPDGTDGIRGFNYGIGDITVTAEAGATISGGRYGIAANGHDGGDARITNAATVNGASAGISAQTTGTGVITIFNSATGVIESSGNSSSPAISIADNPIATSVITNAGAIEASQDSAAALAILEVGGLLTINNSAQIIGDVNLSNAIFNNNVGGDWEIAGINTFAAGINVINNAGTIHSQGSLATVQITAGSLDIVGAINGTVNLAVGDGATLELNGPSSAGQTVTFLGSQGTLKLDQSLTLPFLGPISNLDGTALAHDNIDLADLVWNATSSAQYVSATATSGTLTVTDGVGHSEVFSLVNYSGAGIFTVQSDGQGGTLVFDPPAAATPANSLTAITSGDVEASNVELNEFRFGPSVTDRPSGLSDTDFKFAAPVAHLGFGASSHENANAHVDWHFVASQDYPDPAKMVSRSDAPHLPYAQKNEFAPHEFNSNTGLVHADDIFRFSPASEAPALKEFSERTEGLTLFQSMSVPHVGNVQALLKTFDDGHAGSHQIGDSNLDMTISGSAVHNHHHSDGFIIS